MKVEGRGGGVGGFNLDEYPCFVFCFYRAANDKQFLRKEPKLSFKGRTADSGFRPL